jgi:hypothetical protein
MAVPNENEVRLLEIAVEIWKKIPSEGDTKTHTASVTEIYRELAKTLFEVRGQKAD